MPLSAAATRTHLDAHPTSNANPTIVTVTLEFAGVTFDPVDLYDALDAKWGTVAMVKDSSHRRGPYDFRITP